MNIAELTISEDLLGRKYKGIGIDFKLLREAEQRVVKMLAATKPIEPIQFIEMVLTEEPCEWCSSWWAKVIRKICSTKFAKLIPYPLQELAFARKITRTHKISKQSSIVLKEIHAQLIRLKVNNLEPYCVLLGTKASIVLRDQVLFNTFPYEPLFSECPSVLGVPVITAPFISDNTVIVVPKLQS